MNIKLIAGEKYLSIPFVSTKEGKNFLIALLEGKVIPKNKQATFEAVDKIQYELNKDDSYTLLMSVESAKILKEMLNELNLPTN